MYVIVLVPTTPYQFQQLGGGGVVFCVHIGKYFQSISPCCHAGTKAGGICWNWMGQGFEPSV